MTLGAYCTTTGALPVYVWPLSVEGAHLPTDCDTDKATPADISIIIFLTSAMVDIVFLINLLNHNVQKTASSIIGNDASSFTSFTDYHSMMKQVRKQSSKYLPNMTFQKKVWSIFGSEQRAFGKKKLEGCVCMELTTKTSEKAPL